MPASAMLLLTLNFIASASYSNSEEDGEPTLYWESNDQEHGYIYQNLLVDYGDLTEQFWGDIDERRRTAAKESSPPTVKSPAPDHPVPLRPLTKRGRRSKHKWTEFVAAAVAQCLSGPIRTKGELSAYMKNWSAEHWEEIPDNSQIAAYVTAIFETFRAHWSKIAAPPGRENSVLGQENSSRNAAD